MTSEQLQKLETEWQEKLKVAVLKEREECALLCEEEKINAVHYSATTQSNWLAIKIRNKQ
jgi:hypothetical protein